MRQRRGPSKAAILATALLLIPYVTAASEHERLYHRRSHRESGPADDQQNESDIPGLRLDRDIDATRYRDIKDTNTLERRNRASAVATNPQAPAGQDDQAVRAVQPSRRGSGKSAGIAAPLQARSLRDWEVEDIVLLATVDGSIHARDRTTGSPRWELEVDKPMVETIYHTQNKSEVESLRPEYDFLWIVEPSQDGDIYIYPQGGLGGLQKLHLTVKQLVADMSPYESADPAVVYNGEKRTKLYTVDAKTGTINKVFGAGGTLSKEPRCPKPGGLDILDDEECGSNGSFVLGRTEYTITIQNRDTTAPICTLKYWEWGPNSRDADLHSQYSETMDKRYIYSLHDGSIFGWNHGDITDRQTKYSHKLSSPVVRVFDLARPLHTEDQDPQLIVLPQPVGPIDHEAIYGSMEAKNRIFVNRTEAGGWFALSENMYPLVTGKAKEAQCYDKDWLEWTMSPQCTLAKRQEGLIGVHALSEYEGHSETPLTVSGHPQQPQRFDELPPGPYQEVGRLPSPSIRGRSKIIDGAVENVYDTLIIVALAIITYLVVNRHKLFKAFGKGIRFRNPLIIADPGIASVPSTPTIASHRVTEEPTEIEATAQPMEEEAEGFGDKTKSRSSSLLEPQPNGVRSRSSSVGQRGRVENEKSEKGVRFQDQSPAPVDDGDFDPSQSPQLGKKKARRGARGGVRHKKKRANSQIDHKEEVDQVVKEVMQKIDEPVTQPDPPKIIASTVSAVEDPDGTIRIGRLTVKTDTVLGYGGHGTMVYKGSFDGRDVAVKRMLRDFFDIASHEVSLLQESDDHPNVVRYFDKEEDSQFFYIALELCPASLQDLIERPQSRTEVLQSCPDQPDMLRQITAGLHYLHTLKIVHRDIKPQNILVSNPKVNPMQPGAPPRRQFLISDFGLCKKLEADQNSFRATTAHAAGTSGWRAPELLVDDDPNLKPVASQMTENSEPLVIDTQTKRSATRAIDVFSLGCIFYYCLTNGQHPFDKQDKFMREANIVKGTYNIDALGCLGDYQWEARHLIEEMLKHNPKERPDAAAILRHPFFWSAEDRLNFLCEVSDGFEHEKYKIDNYVKEHPNEEGLRSGYIDYLEKQAPRVIEHGDFLRAFPHEFVLTLGRQRKYKGDSLLDLLRALRNKKNHYEDMPDDLKRKIGGLPDGYLTYWTRRFPNLLLTCWEIIDDVDWSGKERYCRYYLGKES